MCFHSISFPSEWGVEPEYLTSHVNGKVRKASKYSHHNDFDDFPLCLP